MDVQHDEVVSADPETGTVARHTSTQHTASRPERAEARAEKKNQVIWYIVGLLDILLALRIIFLMLGAHNTGFASLIYGITDPFVSLFKGIFASPQVDSAYFDTAGLLAIVIYTLIGWGLSALIDVVSRPAREE